VGVYLHQQLTIKTIISAIKWTFKVYSNNDIAQKMTEFLAWAEKNERFVIEAANGKNTKTQLKNFVARMKTEQSRQDSRTWLEVKTDYAHSIDCEVNSMTGEIYKPTK
jgi:hypothetical protein